MPHKLRSIISITLKICVAGGIIAFLVHAGHLDLKTVWDLMTFPNVVLALTLAGINTLLAAWRWILLLKARGFHVPFDHGFSLYLIGMFFNYALPGAVSGDLVRGYYLVKDYPDRKLDSVLSVLIDRILGLYSFFILTLIAVLWDLDFVMSHEKIRWVALLSFFIFIAMTTFFLLGFSGRIYRFSRLEFIIEKVGPLHKVMQGFQRFGKDRRMLTISLLVSLLAQVFTMIFFYQLGVLLHEPGATWKAILFAVPMGFVVTAVPIAPAGVGVGQVAFLYLFQTYMNKQSQYGAIAITAFQLAVAAWALVGAVVYVKRRKPHELDNLAATMETP